MTGSSLNTDIIGPTLPTRARNRLTPKETQANQGMKSDDAARIFAELDQEVLLQVASRMTDQALAPVLADMSETDAAELTVALARRHQAPETLEALEARGADATGG